MGLIQLTAYEDAALLRMADGVTNPISHALLNDLSEALKRVRRDYRGMVLAGGPKFFSIGLALPQLLSMDRGQFSVFLKKFHEVLYELISLPLPTASAIEGHAIAGGTILALMTDYRFLAGGKSLMGLNEVKLGLSVPYLTQVTLRQLLADNQAKDMLYTGKFVKPDEAYAIGLVDQVCEPGGCEKTALDKITELIKLPRTALTAAKHNRLESLLAQYEQNREREYKLFIDLWFEPRSQELLNEAAKAF